MKHLEFTAEKSPNVQMIENSEKIMWVVEPERVDVTIKKVDDLQ